MKSLLTFFRSVVKSSSDPQYGADIVKAPGSFSWKYFFFFNLILAVAVTVRMTIPVAMFELRQVSDAIVSQYPSDLEINLDEAGLTINQPLPYSVPINLGEFAGYEEMAEYPSNIVTFTTDAEVMGIKDFYAQDSFAVLTETSIYIMEDMDTREVKAIEMPVPETPLMVNAQMINAAVERFFELGFIKNKLYVGVFFAMMLVFSIIGMNIARLWSTFILGLIVFVAGKIFQSAKQVSFGQAMRLVIHAVTPFIIVRFIAETVGFTFAGYGTLLFVAGVTIWSVVWMSNIKPTSSIKQPVAPAKPVKKATIAAKTPKSSK